MGYQTKLLALLETLAAGRQDLSLGAWDPAQIGWIIRSGLGPVSLHAAKGNGDLSGSPYSAALTAADLMARMIAAERVDALLEIIDAAKDTIRDLTLLKGMSIADECYPEFHLRPMSDIDILVPEDDLTRMEKLLRALGYRQEHGGLAGGYRSHHHLAPFFHEGKNVCVEVHHHLLSTRNRASRDPVFALPNVRAQMRRSAFRGCKVYRLSPELQLVYLAAHWAQDFKDVGGIIAVMDMIYLLRRAGENLRWNIVFDWLEGSAAATYLFLLVSYLTHLNLALVPDVVRRRFSHVDHYLGNLGLKAVHSMVDRYIMDGKDFGMLLTKRNLSIAWDTLVLPLPCACKFLLLPLNLCVPRQFRIK